MKKFHAAVLTTMFLSILTPLTSAQSLPSTLPDVSGLIPPSISGSGPVYFEDSTFEVPKEVGPMIVSLDCSTPQSNPDIDMCSSKFMTFANKDWAFDMGSDTYLSADLKNVIASKTKLSDFYGPSGNALSKDKAIFYVPSDGMGILTDFIFDVELITKDGKNIGYIYTQASYSQDFPPKMLSRIALIWQEDTHRFIALKKNLEVLPDTMGGDAEFDYFSKNGKKGSDGKVDITYYSEHLDEMAEILKSFLTEKVLTLTDNKTYYNSIDDLLLQTVNSTSSIQIFNDVNMKDFMADSINYVNKKGYVQGYADGRYKPNELINRAEFVKILVSALEKHFGIGINVEGHANENCFSDVKSGVWYTKYVCYAKSFSILKGYPDGTFGVGKNINLAEAVKIVISAYQLSLSNEIGSQWYDVYFNTMSSVGIRLRFMDQSPWKYITRAEMAEIITQVELNTKGW